MEVVVCDVCERRIINRPIKGVTDLMQVHQIQIYFGNRQEATLIANMDLCDKCERKMQAGIKKLLPQHILEQLNERDLKKIKGEQKKSFKGTVTTIAPDTGDFDG